MKSERIEGARGCFGGRAPEHIEMKKKCALCGKKIYHRLFCLECQEMFKKKLKQMSFREMLEEEKTRHREGGGHHGPR